MKRLLPDTMFARIFMLMFAAILIGHLITFVMLVVVLDYGADFPPPDAMPAPVLLMPDGRTLPLPPPGPEPMFWIGRLAILPPPIGLWQGFLIQISVLTAAAWFGAKAVVRPVQRLAQAATQLGDNLNAPPMDETGPAEARQAAQVFNRMQQRVRIHVEERARFLAAVSHDLRTPLTRMKLRVERLPEDTPGRKLRGDIDEMAALLDAVLEYFRGTDASRPWQVLDVHALLDSMAEDARESGRDVYLQGNARTLSTSPMALRRCLSNLLDNALRYGTRAEISLADSPDMLIIEIRDHGPGIPEDRMQEVLEPFVRLEQSRGKHSGGFGLGLAIAREAAIQCNGELSLRNASDGGLIACIKLFRRPSSGS